MQQAAATIICRLPDYSTIRLFPPHIKRLIIAALKRERHEMPDFIREALTKRGLMEAYLARPDYQQNDYIGWISRAKRESTQEKRLNRMLAELEHGGVYMSMLCTTDHTLFHRHFTG